MAVDLRSSAKACGARAASKQLHQGLPHVASVHRCQERVAVQEFEDMQIDATFAAVPHSTVPTAAEATPDMDLPAAPTTAAGASKTAEDLELEKLLAETGMTPAQ